MYNALTHFVQGQSFSSKIFDRSHSGCQVIELGIGNVFHGSLGQVLPLPSCGSLLCTHSLLCPNTSQCLLHRLNATQCHVQSITNGLLHTTGVQGKKYHNTCTHNIKFYSRTSYIVGFLCFCYWYCGKTFLQRSVTYGY